MLHRLHDASAKALASAVLATRIATAIAGVEKEVKAATQSTATDGGA